MKQMSKLRLLAAGSGLAVLAGSGVPLPAIGAAAPAPRSAAAKCPQQRPTGAASSIKWKPVLVDDFKEKSLKSRYWEAPYNAPTKSPNPTWAKNVRLKDGQLQLTGAVDGPPDADGKPTDVGAGVASKINQRYGRWEIRIRVDAGKGYSGVSTLWPKSDKWPDDGEVDIIETPRPDRSCGNLFLHNATDKKERHVTADFTKWHVLALEWTPKYVAYYLDGKPVWRVDDTAYVPKTPMHLTLQMDQSCAAYGNVCRDRTTPRYVVMHVDYIKIYALPKK